MIATPAIATSPICLQIPFPSMSVNTGDSFLCISIRSSNGSSSSNLNNNPNQQLNNSRLSAYTPAVKQTHFVGRVNWEPSVNFNSMFAVPLFESIGQSVVAAQMNPNAMQANLDNTRLSAS